jgi:benzylsuccinate CoA-transferase BbsE subunit
MLSCYRVLDLTNEKGFLCGKALGDLGADVIKIEKPGGDPSRNIGPFYHDIPDPEKSLYWFAFNANKRSITLDIETADGREVFKNLVKTADVVIEVFKPGYVDDIGLGYSVLSEVNPGIILTSISGFGQKGPYRDYNDRDLAVWGLSGYMYITGEPDRPPLVPSYPHAHLIGAMNGAIGTVIALNHRRLTGRGQQVDACSHQGLCLAISIETKLPWALSKVNVTREGRDRMRVLAKDGQVKIPLLWECKDGSIAFFFWVGPNFVEHNESLIRWIRKSGVDPGLLGTRDWAKEGWNKYTVEEVKQIRATLDGRVKNSDELDKHINEWTVNYTPEQVMQMMQNAGVSAGVVARAQDSEADPQLKAYDFFREIEHPYLGKKKFFHPPGFTLSDATAELHRPVFLGEHTEYICKDILGISDDDFSRMQQDGVFD